MSRRAFHRGVAALLLLTLAAVAALWLARRPLAGELVTRELARRGVESRYVIESVGARRAVLRDVVLGPPGRPDLRARLIVVDYGFGLPPRPRGVRLEGAVLRARWTAAGASFGSLDALIPPGRSRTLPELDVDIPAGTLLLDTPVGPLTLRGSADGWLPDGWRARLALAPTALKIADCRALGARADFAIVTKRHRIDIDAVGGAAALDCSRGVAAGVIDAAARVVVPADLATAGGVLRLGAADARLGAARAAEIELGGTFAGPVGRSRGDWRLVVVAPKVGGARAARVDGRGRFEPHAGGFQATGELVAVDASAATPGDWAAAPGMFGVLGKRLEAALVSAELRAPLAAAMDRGGWRARVPRLDMVATSGARLALDGGGLHVDDGGARLTGTMTLDGGGLPPATLRIIDARPSGGAATVAIAAWRPGAGSPDTLGPVAASLRLAGGVLLVDARAVASGRFGDAAVRGLDMAVDGELTLADGAIALGRNCAMVRFDQLAVASSRLGAARLRSCPRGSRSLTLRGGRLGGGLRLEPVTLRAVADGDPLTLAATRPVDLDFAGTLAAPRISFSSPGVRAAVPAGAGAADLSGTFGWRDGAVWGAGEMWEGRLERATLNGGPMPVAIDAVAARWRLAGTSMSASAATARLADVAPRPRFAPLRLVAGSATVADGKFAGEGALRLAAGGPTLARFVARHDLASGVGEARYDASVTFAPDLQPFQLSELVRGVVENAAGLVTVEGRLAWTAAGLATIPATVKLDAVSFATAALGPVERLSGTLAFTDLAGLVTEPGQRLTIGALNPGVRVEDGIGNFALTGGGAVLIDSIVWPFGGGTLTLQPTVIDPAQPVRRLTLAADGIDAEAFLAQFEIPDLRVTGRFDGVLPLVFAGAAGRIEGGRLAARAPGGVIQYVGEAGSEMGGGARLAFDALRSLRYDNLALRFDGALDGELVTAIDFTGANLLPARLPGALPLRAAGLPFKFGVSVRAPFRALLGTAASFSDVRARLREGAAQADEEP